jgi:hypothetical protein
MSLLHWLIGSTSIKATLVLYQQRARSQQLISLPHGSAFARPSTIRAAYRLTTGHGFPLA